MSTSDEREEAAEAQREALPRTLRPAWCVTLLAHGRVLALGVVLMGSGLLGSALAATSAGLVVLGQWCALVGAALAFGALLLGFVLRLHVRYGIEATHLWARAGVFGTRLVRVPRASVQHATCTRGALERVFGVGSVAVWTSGGQTPAVVFRWLEDAEQVLREVTMPAGEATGSADAPTRGDQRFLVVGLVGTIGAGKSEAARVLQEQGCVVIDADKLAKDALKRPEVKAQLVAWWGEALLGSDNEIDKAKLAGVIFTESSARARLEGVVHPIVHETRAAEIVRARTEGKAGVVIDAPLLFEAGSDKHCDKVLCIDAPREQRLARVIATRGWTDAELARREAAQLTIAQKRARASATIENDGSREQLRERVLAVWESWHRSAG